jgi:predicted RNA-binding Zn-ribbon protein involved in translation (DUF1610 family)
MAAILQRAQRVASQRARCEHCGREYDISADWRPHTCPHCGLIDFPPDSRSRVVAVYIALVAVAVLTALAWFVLG